jgi:hypothetical protein
VLANGLGVDNEKFGNWICDGSGGSHCGILRHRTYPGQWCGNNQTPKQRIGSIIWANPIKIIAKRLDQYTIFCYNIDMLCKKQHFL